MKYEIIVELQKEVLDPQARAIKKTLEEQGFSELKGVTLSKRYLIELESNTKNACEHVQKIASSYLANPVSERYKINRIDDD